jgi:hypothetical protein
MECAMKTALILRLRGLGSAPLKCVVMQSNSDQHKGIQTVLDQLCQAFAERDRRYPCFPSMSNEEIVLKLAPIVDASDEDFDTKLLADLARDNESNEFIGAYSELEMLRKVRETYPKSIRCGSGPDITIRDHSGAILGYIEVTIATDGKAGPHFDDNLLAPSNVKSSGNCDLVLTRITSAFTTKQSQYKGWIEQKSIENLNVPRFVAINISQLKWAVGADGGTGERGLTIEPLIKQALGGSGFPIVSLNLNGLTQIGISKRCEIEKNQNTNVSANLFYEQSTIQGVIQFRAHPFNGPLDASGSRFLLLLAMSQRNETVYNMFELIN